MKISQVPPRVTTGAFVLNSGLSKLQADEETAKHLHAMASGAYPAFEKLDPSTFTKILATAEIALGSALLTPVLPRRLVGLGLTAFSAGLIGLYLKTPGMTMQGSVRPTRDGMAMAKDSWMLGIGLSLLIAKDEKSARSRRA
ncbi:MAG: hypothetical protein ACYDD4_03805 [Acidimicrobiales bacterium]